jgi:hypothetical protein
LPCAYIIAAIATDSGVPDCGGSSQRYSKWAANHCEFVGTEHNAAATSCAAAASSSTELCRFVLVILGLTTEEKTVHFFRHKLFSCQVLFSFVPCIDICNN